MSFNQQAMLLSSPSGLASNILKGVGKRIKFLEAHGTRRAIRYSEWHCKCDSQKLSAIVNGLNHAEGSDQMHQKSHNSSQKLNAYENANILGPQQADHSDGLRTTAAKKLDAFHRFVRPYALVGTTVTAIAVAFLPVEHITDLSPFFFVGLLKTILPVVLMTIYTMGVNQVFDVEIDKVNKPSLPLASGELSMKEGILIVAACSIMSLLMGVKSGSPPLLYALIAWFFLASAYAFNLPLLRWKENPFLTTIGSICHLGIVPHILFFMHFQKYVLGKPVVLTKSIVLATAFMSLFAGVLSVLKDIPDVEGDKRAGIKNFVVHLGPERVFWLGTNALLVGYGIAMLVGAASASTYSSLITVLGHGLLASILWARARSVTIQNKTSMQSFYMYLWQLRSVEYLLLPFVR